MRRAPSRGFVPLTPLPDDRYRRTQIDRTQGERQMVMNGMSGMNVDSVRDCAASIDGLNYEISAMLDRLMAMVNSLEWAGTDRDRFVGEIDVRVANLKSAVESHLMWMKETMTYNADYQEMTSSSAWSRATALPLAGG